MVVATGIPSNVRRIRIAKGLTQGEVAARAGISRQAFRSIETGEAQPRVSSLQGIAAALDVSLPELLAEPPSLATVRLRSSKVRRQRDRAARDQVTVDVARWLKDFNGLEDLLGERKPYALAGLTGKLSDRPIEAARQARQGLNLREDEPIRDIRGLLESAGVKILAAGLPVEDLFGLSVAAGDGGPAIVVNAREDISVERRIFTAAHELGHLLLHPSAYDIAKEAEDRDEERAANLFASHFLMPDGIFRREWRGTSGVSFVDRVLHVKRVFRVSYQTVLYRLAESGLPDPGKAWMVFKADCKRRYGLALTRKVEPDALPEAEAELEPKRLDEVDFVEDRLSRLVRRAVESEKITLSRAAEILRIDLGTMRELVSSWEVAA